VRATGIVALILCSVTFALAGQDVAGKPPVAWLGLGLRPARSASTGRAFLHVDRVTRAGPGEKAGIRPGDIIDGMSGFDLNAGDDLDFILFLAGRPPGDRLRLRVIRDGKARSAVVVLAELPESSRAAWEHALERARQKRANASRRR